MPDNSKTPRWFVTFDKFFIGCGEEEVLQKGNGGFVV